MTDLPPCDPTLELCPDAAHAGNETVAAEESKGGMDLGKIALLAVGGAQVAAGVVTYMDVEEFEPMTIVNTAFGALGVFLGVHQLFLAQPYEECPPEEEAPVVEEEVPAEEVVALRQDPMTEEAPVEEEVAVVEEPSCGPGAIDMLA